MTNRTICDILVELRKCDETKNYSYFLSLLEEIQSAANRMEAALGEAFDYEELIEKRRKLKDVMKKARESLKKLKEELGDKTPEAVAKLLKDDLRWL